MTTFPIIGYAGMTHLGLCSAIASASKGFTTIGFDEDGALVLRLEVGKLPVVEAGLDDLLAANRARISFTSDHGRLASCDVVYVAPDVATDDAASSDLTTIDRLLALVLDFTPPETVVVVLSQVPPGFTRSRERRGRLIFYQVETLVFGRAVERATEPERFIVGCPDPMTELPASLAAFLSAYGCRVLPMGFESAELTKIAINCFLVASISTTNTLAELCERIGADWSEIAPALRLDRRIGQHAYLAPGLGIAGGNLERDLATIIRLAKDHGTDAGAIGAFLENSAHRKDWALRTLHEAALPPEAVIAVLGLAYKEQTNSVKNSPSLALIGYLTPWKLRVFDPVVPASAAPHPNVAAATSPINAAIGADALAIMTPWPEFRALAPADIAGVMRGRIVLDPYRVLDAKAAREVGLDYRTLGAA